MNLKDNLDQALNEKEVEKIPVVAMTSVVLKESMEIINVNYPEGHINPEKMAKLASSAYKLTGNEGMTLPFDMTIESEAMGCEVDLGEGVKNPEISKTPFNTPEEIEISENFLENGRIPILMKAMDILKEEYENVPIICNTIGPFTLLGQLIGIENLLKYLNTNCYAVEEALEIVTDSLIEFIYLLNEAEPDAICLCEPSAATDLLSPDNFKQLIFPLLETITPEIDKNSILHICGNTTQIIPSMLSCGFNGISIEDSVDVNYINKTKKEINSHTQICGNISTNQTLFKGSVSDVEKECLIALKKGVNVLAPSCSVAPYSPLNNIRAMVNARNKYYNE